MTARPLFPAQEIGSLMKPRWQILGQRGEPLDDAARQEFTEWNQRVSFAPPGDASVHSFLNGHSREIGLDQVRDWGALFALRLFETAGLTRVYDGEARRIEMYEYAIRQMKGFQFLGHVRSFDNKYYLKAAGTGEVKLEQPYHVEEFEFVRRHTTAEPKLPITGPYTLADWSYNEHYLAKQAGWKGREARRRGQRDFVVAIARHAIRPTLQALVEHGCKVIQVDEPAAGTHPDEADLVAEGFNAATEGIDGEFSMHICFSRYRDLFPAILEAKRVSQWAWEFANRDTEDHDGYETLKLFREYGDTREIGLGVTDVHRDEVESAEQIRERILRASKILGDPGRIWVNPDCGLRTRRIPVAYQKLENMVRGAALARAELTSGRPVAG